MTKKDDEDVTGRVVEENDTQLVLVPNQLTGEKVVVKKSEVKSRARSKVSPMPSNLCDILSREEILDLLAYLESGGNAKAAVFAK